MSLFCKIQKRAGRFKLNVEFEAGNETVALLGASGSGKSMTLRCIAGIEKPDKGTIIINGRTVFDSERGINLAPQKRYAGYLFQDFALFPNMTVYKNIYSVVPKGEKEKTAGIIEALHLKGMEGHYPSQLSGGQKQRCALARMIASEPEIIMLDEPFSALDSYLRWKMEQEVVSVINKTGRTVLLVSHDRDEIYRISDRVIVINNGKSGEIRSKQELYQNPHTCADALLTGCKNIIPVQFQEGTVVAPEYGIRFPGAFSTEEIAYIGIRAKRIVPAYEVKAPEEALFLRYEITSVTEGVFSMILMVRVEDGEAKICWEILKDRYEAMAAQPKVLAIFYKDIFMLKRDMLPS